MVNFVRIPKCASTSVYNHLGDKNNIRDELLIDVLGSRTHQGVFAPSHCPLSIASKHIGYEILNQPTFTVIRNPFDRMVSMWKFHLKADFIPFKIEEFDRFVRFIFHPDTFLPIAQNSQSYYLDLNVDVEILRFENLASDFATFVDKHQLDIDPVLPHENASRPTEDYWVRYYNPLLLDLVKTFWREDFDKFF